MINVDFLEYIIEFAKTENLSKASEALFISQSALTRAMQRIEKEVGVPLFFRTRNKLLLNETGKIFVKYAEKVIDAENEMIAAAQGYHNSLTSISIGLIAPGPMIKYGAELFNAFPGKTLSTKIDGYEALKKELIEGVYDVIFVNKPIENKDLICEFVFKETLNAAVTKDHFLAEKTSGVTFKDLDGLPFLVADSLGVWDEIIHTYLPNSKFYRENLNDLHEFIVSSTIPHFSTNETLKIRSDESRVNVPILDKEASVDFYVVYPKANKAKIEALLKIIKDYQ